MWSLCSSRSSTLLLSQQNPVLQRQLFHLVGQLFCWSLSICMPLDTSDVQGSFRVSDEHENQKVRNMKYCVVFIIRADTCLAQAWWERFVLSDAKISAHLRLFNEHASVRYQNWHGDCSENSWLRFEGARGFHGKFTSGARNSQGAHPTHRSLGKVDWCTLRWWTTSCANVWSFNWDIRSKGHHPSVIARRGWRGGWCFRERSRQLVKMVVILAFKLLGQRKARQRGWPLVCGPKWQTGRRWPRTRVRHCPCGSVAAWRFEINYFTQIQCELGLCLCFALLSNQFCQFWQQILVAKFRSMLLITSYYYIIPFQYFKILHKYYNPCYEGRHVMRGFQSFMVWSQNTWKPVEGELIHETEICPKQWLQSFLLWIPKFNT